MTTRGHWCRSQCRKNDPPRQQGWGGCLGDSDFALSSILKSLVISCMMKGAAHHSFLGFSSLISSWTRPGCFCISDKPQPVWWRSFPWRAPCKSSHTSEPTAQKTPRKAASEAQFNHREHFKNPVLTKLLSASVHWTRSSVFIPKCFRMYDLYSKQQRGQRTHHF